MPGDYKLVTLNSIKVDFSFSGINAHHLSGPYSGIQQWPINYQNQRCRIEMIKHGGLIIMRDDQGLKIINYQGKVSKNIYANNKDSHGDYICPLFGKLVHVYFLNNQIIMREVYPGNDELFAFKVEYNVKGKAVDQFIDLKLYNADKKKENEPTLLFLRYIESEGQQTQSSPRVINNMRVNYLWINQDFGIINKTEFTCFNIPEGQNALSRLCVNSEHEDILVILTKSGANTPEQIWEYYDIKKNAKLGQGNFQNWVDENTFCEYDTANKQLVFKQFKRQEPVLVDACEVCGEPLIDGYVMVKPCHCIYHVGCVGAKCKACGVEITEKFHITVTGRE